MRLEARPDDVKRLDQWQWNDNPFKGKRELQGLKIMMSFLNNWDMKNANNVILKRGDELQYVISDLGVSFGKTGSNGTTLFWRFGRSRNEPDQYAESDFVKDIKNGKIKFAFNGKGMELFNDITRRGWPLARRFAQPVDGQTDRGCVPGGELFGRRYSVAHAGGKEPHSCSRPGNALRVRRSGGFVNKEGYK